MCFKHLYYALFYVAASVPYGLVTRKQKNVENIKISIKVGTSKRSANFQLNRSKVKVIERKKNSKIVAYLAFVFTFGWRPAAQAPTATGRTAAYHVGTWRRHLFLLCFQSPARTAYRTFMLAVFFL